MYSQSVSSTLILIICTLCWLATVTTAQSLRTRSATASTYVERGNDWYTKGEYARAEADYDLAISADPTLALAYFNRAVARHRIGKLAEALSDFDRAIQLNPRFIEAYVNRAGLRFELGDLGCHQ
jgi:Tfp pilus assembly protein PilF